MRLGVRRSEKKTQPGRAIILIGNVIRSNRATPNVRWLYKPYIDSGGDATRREIMRLPQPLPTRDSASARVIITRYTYKLITIRCEQQIARQAVRIIFQPVRVVERHVYQADRYRAGPGQVRELFGISLLKLFGQLIVVVRWTVQKS